MTYSNKCVFCVMQNGNACQELANGTVYVPMGSEYSIRLRNKNDRRAVADIWIDGELVSGPGYVVPANDGHIDIKRHHNHDAAFKFVELDSSEAVEAGKNGPNSDKEKGTIKVRFRLEKKFEPVKVVDHHHYHHDYYGPWRSPSPYPHPWKKPFYDPYGPSLGGSISWTTNQSQTSCNTGEQINNLNATYTTKSSNVESIPLSKSVIRSRGAGASVGLQSAGRQDSVTESLNSITREARAADGCTVQGAATGQRFTSVNIELEEGEGTILRLFLQGTPREVVTAVLEKRPTNKDSQLTALEEENQRLREELARRENEELKAKLSKPKAKRAIKGRKAK